MGRLSWDAYFMSQAYLAADRSKDPSTHVGAVIVNNRNHVVATGYNGFPAGLDDDELLKQGREVKLALTVHAEANAICSAASSNVSILGCKMYVFFTPCIRCAVLVAQAGIKEVIVDRKWQEIIPEDWQKSTERSIELFQDLGIKFRAWDGELAKIKRFCRGEIIE
jgi:dCMP deaminase